MLDLTYNQKESILDDIWMTDMVLVIPLFQDFFKNFVKMDKNHFCRSPEERKSFRVMKYCVLSELQMKIRFCVVEKFEIWPC